METQFIQVHQEIKEYWLIKFYTSMERYKFLEINNGFQETHFKNLFLS